MNYWLLALCLMNVLLLAHIGFSLLTKNKKSAEDQRLTKGLQLLQNKISILQDLSDKTDEQVRKWLHLLEQKAESVQAQLTQSDEKIVQIEEALSKALDVSKIFYEQVPHAEIVERQKTSKYVQAAKLANQGFSTDQISQKIDLSTAEIDMIIKLNRDELQFSEEGLPAWIQTAASTPPAIDANEVSTFNAQIQQFQKMNKIATPAATFEMEKPDMSSMQQIQNDFTTAVKTNVTDKLSKNSTHIPQTFIVEERKNEEGVTRTASGQIVRPFMFKKITK